MKKKKNVLVACGAGIATSTVVNSALEELAKQHNIAVNLIQIKIAEVNAYVETADLLVSTTIVHKEYPFPVINAKAFLTGIGLDEVKQHIVDELKK
ncbi:PTS system IIB component, Gat family [Amphibacillus marinus]|uniref:PTS system IIB component, Gat family n=1 Tax=Amphibacillus marinus TaxID=872970 RepID=A0A1H8PHH6_9BACI|nr:PTS sugar transporter subunit IIB [Amphibacillus marinus]SEO41459.1 PTS system IIB component, Gat family [Amphibacillus marinus]